MRNQTLIARAFVTVALLCWLSVPVLAEVGFGVKGGVLMPDQDPFKDEFDENILIGGVLEFDSNLGLIVEASLEYFGQDSNTSGDITIFPLLVSAKYNFFPRYRTTPYIGVGIGTYFFDQTYKRGDENKTTSKTQYGVRICGGVRFLEDRRVNLVIEAARNFVDFRGMNASSFQVTAGFLFDFYPGIISAP